MHLRFYESNSPIYRLPVSKFTNLFLLSVGSFSRPNCITSFWVERRECRIGELSNVTENHKNCENFFLRILWWSPSALMSVAYSREKSLRREENSLFHSSTLSSYFASRFMNELFVCIDVSFSNCRVHKNRKRFSSPFTTKEAQIDNWDC